jgi:N-acetylneuraminic acid mutarotase
MLLIMAGNVARRVEESSMWRYPWQVRGLVVLAALVLGGLFLVTQPAQADHGPAVFVERTPLPAPVYQHAVAADGTYFYVIGGQIWNGSGLDALGAVYRYDPGADSYTARASLPAQWQSIAACAMNGKIYVPGGYNVAGQLYERTLYIHDIAGDHWTTGPTLPAPGLIRYAAVCDAAANKLYVVSGSDSSGTPWPVLKIFDVGANSWSTGAPPPEGRAGAQAGLINGKIYVAGGLPATGTATADVQQYNIATDSWSAVAPMTVGGAFGAAGVYNGALYVAGGSTVSTNGGYLNRTERYDPAGNTWTALDPLLRAVQFTGGAFLGNAFYVAGGRTTYNTDPRCPGLASLGGICDHTQQLIVPPGASTATPTATPTATRTRTPGATATPPPNATGTATAAPDPTGTATSVPNATASATPTAGPPAATETPVATAVSTPTVPATATSATASATPTGTAGPEPTACALAFTDVLADSVFYPYITCLACRGIVSGYQDGTFRPGNPLSRGQLAKVVAGGAGFTDAIPAAQQSFADVPPGHPFWRYIEVLALHGTISGYDCGGAGEPCDEQGRPYFRPYVEVTRGQIAKIVVGAAGWSGAASAQVFEDVPPGHPFYDWIGQAAAHGILSGYTCGSDAEPCIEPGRRPYFRPAVAATRGQMSKIIYNAFPAAQPCPAGAEP